MRVAVLIPFHKEQEKLDKCKAAVLTSKTSGFEIDLCVENDSDTETGFTKTVNRGLKQIVHTGNYAYALVLNQDCYLQPEAIEALFKFMQSHPKCGIAGIKQLSSEDNDQIIHGGTKQAYPAGVHEGGLVSRGDCAKSKKVPWVNGAIMMIRLETLLDTGLLDENMIMFGSDSDISHTMRARGWECWYCAEAVGVHEQIASRGTSEKMQKQLKLDMLYFKDKWISGELFEDLVLELL